MQIDITSKLENCGYEEYYTAGESANSKIELRIELAEPLRVCCDAFSTSWLVDYSA
jgi:hypothetical protein